MINDPTRWGVSFSIKQCKAFGLSYVETLHWLLQYAGFRRFRLMSYWNEHEKNPGEFDFSSLDMQINLIAQAGGRVTLCLGARQPRWPENHWPDWAWDIPKKQRTQALLRYVQTVVERYKHQAVIVSWQLENEALLKNFGRRAEVDRKRLRNEFKLVKTLDPTRHIIMSTSNGWGVPMRKPIPDIVGFSYYAVMHKKGKYRKSVHRPWLYKLRKAFISFWWGKPVFIHELQCEPWGPDAIWKISLEEQANSINPDQIAKIINDAKKIGAYPIDLWGAEWWYWRLKRHDDPTIWDGIDTSLRA